VRVAAGCDGDLVVGGEGGGRDVVRRALPAGADRAVEFEVLEDDASAALPLAPVVRRTGVGPAGAPDALLDELPTVPAATGGHD
jgi:hypothetical protein